MTTQINPKHKNTPARNALISPQSHRIPIASYVARGFTRKKGSVIQLKKTNILIFTLGGWVFLFVLNNTAKSQNNTSLSIIIN